MIKQKFCSYRGDLIYAAMDEQLQRLLHLYKIGHYEHKLEGLGVRKIEDLHHIEAIDLDEIGMRKFQLRAFEKMCQTANLELQQPLPSNAVISPVPPQENLITKGPAPPNHPPPAALLTHHASASATGKKRPAPPDRPPPASFLSRTTSSKTEKVGEIVEGVCGGKYIYDADKKELYEISASDYKRDKKSGL